MDNSVVQGLQPIQLDETACIDKKYVSFPKVNHGIIPVGNQILVMGQYIPRTTKGGIELDQSYRRTTGYDIAIGRVESMGNLAFKDKQTMVDWKEGSWCKVDDVIFLPRTGHRIEKYINGDLYTFVLISDVDVMAVIENLDGFAQFEI